MSTPKAKDGDYVSVLDVVALIIFAVAVITTVIGIVSSILGARTTESIFAFAAGWDHTAMIIGGFIGIAVSGALSFVSNREKKSLR